MGFTRRTTPFGQAAKNNSTERTSREPEALADFVPSNRLAPQAQLVIFILPYASSTYHWGMNVEFRCITTNDTKNEGDGQGTLTSDLCWNAILSCDSCLSRFSCGLLIWPSVLSRQTSRFKTVGCGEYTAAPHRGCHKPANRVSHPTPSDAIPCCTLDNTPVGSWPFF